MGENSDGMTHPIVCKTKQKKKKKKKEKKNQESFKNVI